MRYGLHPQSSGWFLKNHIPSSHFQTAFSPHNNRYRCPRRIRLPFSSCFQNLLHNIKRFVNQFCRQACHIACAQEAVSGLCRRGQNRIDIHAPFKQLLCFSERVFYFIGIYRNNRRFAFDDRDFLFLKKFKLYRVWNGISFFLKPARA